MCTFPDCYHEDNIFCALLFFVIVHVRHMPNNSLLLSAKIVIDLTTTYTCIYSNIYNSFARFVVVTSIYNTKNLCAYVRW